MWLLSLHYFQLNGGLKWFSKHNFQLLFFPLAFYMFPVFWKWGWRTLLYVLDANSEEFKMIFFLFCLHPMYFLCCSQNNDIYSSVYVVLCPLPSEDFWLFSYLNQLCKTKRWQLVFILPIQSTTHNFFVMSSGCLMWPPRARTDGHLKNCQGWKNTLL